MIYSISDNTVCRAAPGFTELANRQQNCNWITLRDKRTEVQVIFGQDKITKFTNFHTANKNNICLIRFFF